MKRDDIINYGTSASSHWKNKSDFIIRWSFKVAYKNSRTTWMVGRGSAANGARYKLYQDSNNNGKYDGAKRDTYVGYGSVNVANYQQFASIFKGTRAEVFGYADYTADLVIGGQTISTANWF